MMENSECKYCKTWEEEMYWKHFNSIQFFLDLTPNSHDHLVLPEKFSAHMKSQLPDNVFLKGPNGAIWEIELLKSDGLQFVGDGWKDFVKVNELKENCVLMFKFKRYSSFEVVIFDKGSSCEKEATYFVKKCKHTKSCIEDKKKRTVREASNTEVAEDDGEEDSAFVVSKKSKKDDEAVVSSGGMVNNLARRKRALNAAAKARGLTRRILSRQLPIKRKVQSGNKSFRNETDKEPSQISQGDVITPNNGEKAPENGHSDKLDSLCKKSLNKNGADNEQSQVSRRGFINPENGEIFPSAEHSETSKGQREEHPNGNHIADKSIPSSEKEFITTSENGESLRVKNHTPKLKPHSEKRPSSDGNTKEPTKVLEKEMITPENGKKFPVANSSNGSKGQAEKESYRRRLVKEPRQTSGRELIRPNYRESSSEDDHPSKSRVKRSRPKKQEPPNSSKKPVFRSVSEERKSVKEYMSNRRPVTEAEKKDAMNRAYQKQSEDSFAAIMQPTSVYSKFFLDIPAKWMQQHLPSRNQEVILRVGNKKWHTTLISYGKKDASISTGWKNFALDNLLEEFDVLVFHLVTQKDNASAVMDVDIFRVVQDPVPPQPLMA